MRSIFSLVLVSVLGAQEAGFNVESRLVSVPVSVTDREGRSVPGLAGDSFVLLDNGKSQQIVVDTFETGTAPIALIVAVQSSGISVPALQKVQKIRAMIQPMITGERGCAGLLSFAERVQWRQDCTNSVDKLSKAFDELSPGEDKVAHMLDAVNQAIEHLRQRPKVRRVILLISESRDRGSDMQLEEVVIHAQAAGVTVYCATYSAFKTAFTTKSSSRDPVPEPVAPRSTRTEPLSAQGRVPIAAPEQRVDILGGIVELKRLGKVKASDALSQATGGTTFSFTRQKALEDAIEKLGEEMHTQYILSFTPVKPEPGRHTLEVRIPSRANLRIRARPAYWSVVSR